MAPPRKDSLDPRSETWNCHAPTDEAIDAFSSPDLGHRPKEHTATHSGMGYLVK